MDFVLTRITYRDDGASLSEEDIRVQTPQINDKEYKARLKEINETYRIIRDDLTGRTFEMAIVNQSRLSSGAILMPSTMFSSLTQNPGNAIELAAHGAAIPDMARVYIAFPGNGGSENMSLRDRQYLARTGRFTRDGNALDSISALVRALDDNNISIRCISANAEGGRLGLGIMAALPANTVTAVYFNGMPGISVGGGKTYTSAMIEEDKSGWWGRRSEDVESQPDTIESVDAIYRVSNRTVEEARSSLTNIYKGYEYRTRLLSTYFRGVPNMLASIHAFSRHADLQTPQTHAVLQDSLTALKRQSLTMVTFQFCRYSELHMIDECIAFGQTLTAYLNRIQHRSKVQLFISDGTLDFHTDYPSKRWAAERTALSVQMV